MTELSFSFLGGAREVGKSCHTIEAKGARYMIDCGLKLTDPPSYPKIPTKTDAVILTHAHLDHSGNVPTVHKRNQIPVYGTDVTFEVAHILQHDSIKVEHLQGYPTRYSDADVDDLVHSEIPLNYEKPRRISEDAVLTLYDAGHIPGSSGALLEINGTRVFHTGDTNNKDTMLLSGGKYPKADILMLESTYGNRVHPDRGEQIDSFIDSVEETINSGGVALVPAFGVGRSQEVLMMLDQLAVPIYFDGMCKTVARIFLEYSEYLRDAELLQKAASSAIWVHHQGERRKITREPCVIVTTAGMLTGGPVMQYIKKLHKDAKSSLFLTGYQVENTNGRLLLEEGYVIDELTKRRYRVSMNVEQFDFSAHADQNGLIEIADQVDPEKIFLIHGDPESCLELSQKLEPKYEVTTPQLGEKITVNLDA